MGQCRYLDSAGTCLVNVQSSQCFGTEDQRCNNMVCGFAVLFQNERAQVRRDVADFEKFFLKFQKDIASIKATLIVYETWVKTRARDGVITGLSYHNWLEIQRNYGRIIEGSGDYIGHYIFNI